jgi:hypothetical protein
VEQHAEGTADAAKDLLDGRDNRVVFGRDIGVAGDGLDAGHVGLLSGDKLRAGSVSESNGGSQELTPASGRAEEQPAADDQRERDDRRHEHPRVLLAEEAAALLRYCRGRRANAS